MTKFELAPLPYAYDALEPMISAETLHFHHDKHHQAYVNKLNELLPGSGFENDSLEEIILKAEGSLFNQAAQVWNHEFYWKSMDVRSKNRSPESKLLTAIEKTFDSVADFKKEFEKKAAEQFGSGWAWLVSGDQGQLQILTTPDADNPLCHGLTPLFGCDVWEHAYYVDYRNGRAKYLKEFWGVVNWSFAEENYMNLNPGNKVKNIAKENRVAH